MRTFDLTKGPINKLLVKLTTPMVFGMFSMMVFNLVDTYFISRLGVKPLAAMTFTFPVIMVVMSISLGIGTGTASVISRTLGFGSKERVKRLIADSLVLAVLVGLAFVAVGLTTMKSVFTSMGASADIYPLIKQYMTVWFIGVGFVIVPITGNHALRASGDTFTPAVIMAVASIINIVLDPVMIFGLFGMPRLELAGAALATVLSRAFSFIIAMYILHHKKHMIDLRVPHVREVLASWKHLLYIGLPASATNLFFSLTMGAMTRIIAFFGPFAVAAVGAGIRIESFALMVYFALMSSLVPFFGQNWGAGELERVHTAHRKSNYFSLFWGAGCFILFLLLGRHIGGIFSDDPRVVSNIALFLRISSLSYGFRGICMIAVAMFNAINMPIRATIFNITRMFGLYIPLAYIGSRLAGFVGVLAGMSSANFLAGGFALLWVKRIGLECEMDRYFKNNHRGP